MRHSNKESKKNSDKSNHHNKGKKKMTTPYSYATNYTSKCDHKPAMIKVGDTQIGVCARRNAYMGLSGFDVISPLVESGGADFHHFYGMLLWFPIGDMTAPATKRLEIHARRLIELARAGNNVLTFCEGSHGRTGTVIAACIALLEPDVDPIDAVRERHCAECVETQAQVEVIFKVAKRPLPKKWSPEEREKKYQPKWVQQGRLWTNSTDKLVGTLVAPSYNFNECDYCREGDSVELGRLHWFGSTVSHASCYEIECVRQKDAKAKADAEKATINTPIVSGTQLIASAVTIPSSAQPSADSPPLPKSVLSQSRPFCYGWTPETKANVAVVSNANDQFGDFICVDCDLLITDAARAQIYTDPQPIGKVLVHVNCDAAFHAGGNVPLCPMCNLKNVEVIRENHESIKTAIVQKYCIDCGKNQASVAGTQANVDQI